MASLCPPTCFPTLVPRTCHICENKEDLRTSNSTNDTQNKSRSPEHVLNHRAEWRNLLCYLAGLNNRGRISNYEWLVNNTIPDCQKSIWKQNLKLFKSMEVFRLSACFLKHCFSFVTVLAANFGWDQLVSSACCQQSLNSHFVTKASLILLEACKYPDMCAVLPCSGMWYE